MRVKHLKSIHTVRYVILQGLLCAHDAVAQKDYYPHLPDIPVEAVDEDEETVKIVQLVKSNEPLVSCVSCYLDESISSYTCR